MEMIRINNCNNHKVPATGMTLIELMIVLALIALLSAVTYPRYNAHVQQTHRTQVMADMARIQLQLESSYHNGYHSQAVFDDGQCRVCQSDPARYQLTLDLFAGGYRIYATPQTASGQSHDQCGGQSYAQLTLSSQGERLPAACWR